MTRAFVLAAGFFAASCGAEDTSVVLSIDPQSGSSLRVRVCDRDGGLALDRSFEVGDRAVRKVLLTPRGGDASTNYFASLELSDGQRVLARRRLAGGYVAEERVELGFELASECSSADCGEDLECQAGICTGATQPVFLITFPDACGFDSDVIPLAPCDEIDGPALLYCNDFADGVGDGWDTNEQGGSTVEWKEDEAGYLRANVVAEDTAANARNNVAAPLDSVDEFYMRVRFRVSSFGFDYFKVLRILAEDSRGRYELGLEVHGTEASRDGMGPFVIFADSEQDGPTVPTPAVGEWSCAHVHVVLGPVGSVSVSVGEVVSQTEPIEDRPDGEFEEIRVGATFVNGGVGVFDVDDFAVATRPLACD